MVPIVTTIEGRPKNVTRPPLKAPQIAPTLRPVRTSIAGLAPVWAM